MFAFVDLVFRSVDISLLVDDENQKGRGGWQYMRNSVSPHD